MTVALTRRCSVCTRRDSYETADFVIAVICSFNGCKQHTGSTDDEAASSTGRSCRKLDGVHVFQTNQHAEQGADLRHSSSCRRVFNDSRCEILAPGRAISRCSRPLGVMQQLQQQLRALMSVHRH